MDRIYLSPPHMGASERALLLDAFDSNWVAPLGPHVDAFESEFAAKIGIPHAAALSSGTAALHLALLLVGVRSGDDVVTSTLTFAATANAITYVGARPRFIDCDPGTWNMDPGLLAEELDEALKAGRRPAAVVVVDLYGQCADMDPIADLCRRHGIPLIEDAAEALGATYRGKPAGTLGDVGIFSFNGNKIITTSGGGMIVSSRRDIVDKARFLATQARDPAPHYQHSHIGYNYRLSNLLAAVGRGQLRALEERVAARRANNLEYRRAFREVQGLDFMPDAPYGTPTAWLTCVTVAAESFGASRDQIRQYLEGHNIESRPVWKPMHLQPIFAGCSVRGGKVAEDLFARGLCLPSGSSLTPEQRARVVERVLDVPRHVGGGLGSASDSGR